MTAVEKVTNKRTTTALKFARRGWHVFPLIPGSIRPAVPNHSASNCDGADPRCYSDHAGWEQRATTDPNRVVRGWSRRSYGIGIATGPSGLIVIDLDVGEDSEPSGAQALMELEAEHGQTLPETWTVATPSGGWHLYYLQPQGRRLRNTASTVGRRIDTRGWGGYVAAPPTTTPTGIYTTIKPIDPVPLPQWFSQLLATDHQSGAEPLGQQQSLLKTKAMFGVTAGDRYVAAAIESQLRLLATAETGNRNQTLYVTCVALGQLVAAGVADQADVVHQIETVIGSHVAAGAYTWAQAQRTMRSGLDRGLNEPRRLPAHLSTNTN